MAKFGSATVDAAHVFVELVESAGGRADVASTQGSITAAFETSNRPIYPLFLSRFSKGSVQLGLGYLASRTAFKSDEARKDLLDRLTAVVGPLSTSTLNGSPAFSVTKLNDPGVRAGLADFIDYLRKAEASAL